MHDLDLLSHGIIHTVSLGALLVADEDHRRQAITQFGDAEDDLLDMNRAPEGVHVLYAGFAAVARLIWGGTISKLRVGAQFRT